MGLPLRVLPLPSQRYSCHGCGDCCRDFTVQLSEEDRARLADQRWDERLGEPVTVEFRGTTVLRQRDDGACIFLQSDGLCRVHAEFGFDEKPLACRVFPFSFAPGPGAVTVGINFACTSVRESRGVALSEHGPALRGFQSLIPEAQRASVVRLSAAIDAHPVEISALTESLARWLGRTDVPFATRLDGLAWFSQQLLAARFDTVRGERFVELVELLIGALPQELEHHPIEAPTARQRSLLRQAVFARTEDPKISALARRGRWRTVLAQLWRSRVFSRGRGTVPAIGLSWPRGATFEEIDRTTAPGSAQDLAAIDELMTRWLTATILGGRAWGSGYYGWSQTEGLGAMVINLASVGWLARAHAAASGREPGLEDVRAALGRIDRSAGRAPWLGGSPERLRTEYMARDHGLRRAVSWAWFESRSASDAQA